MTDLGYLQPAADADPSGAWLEDALAAANIPTLLALLVQMTGELRWLDPPYQPSRNRGLGDNDDGGLPDAVQDEIRAAAQDAIRRWQADGQLAIPDPPPDLLLRIMTVIMGEPVPAEYAPMMASELAARRQGQPPRRECLPLPPRRRPASGCSSSAGECPGSAPPGT